MIQKKKFLNSPNSKRGHFSKRGIFEKWNFQKGAIFKKEGAVSFYFSVVSLFARAAFVIKLNKLQFNGVDRYRYDMIIR